MSSEERPTTLEALIQGFDPVEYGKADDERQRTMIRNLFFRAGDHFGVDKERVADPLKLIPLDRFQKMTPRDIVYNVTLEVASLRFGNVDPRGRQAVSPYTSGTIAAAALVAQKYGEAYPSAAEVTDAEQQHRVWGF